MKKMIKLSLVAAVAVAGLSTTASAQSMEDAIKGVSIKGYYQYRWDKDIENKKSVTNSASSDANKFRAQATAKANDKVSFTARMTSYAGGAHSGTNIDRTFITVQTGNLTTHIGRLTDPSPFTDGAAMFGQIGLYKVSNDVTLAGAYYNMDQTPGLSADTEDVMALAALANFGPANVNLWYVTQKDALTNVFASVMAKAGSVNVEAAYSFVSDDANVGAMKDQTQTRLMVSTKIDKLSLKGGVVVAGKDGAAVGTLGGNDGDEKANFESSKISTDGVTDETGVYANVGMKINPEMGASLEYYGIGDGKDITAKVTYQIAKNLSSYVRYSGGKSITDADVSALRVQLKYSF